MHNFAGEPIHKIGSCGINMTLTNFDCMIPCWFFLSGGTRYSKTGMWSCDEYASKNCRIKRNDFLISTKSAVRNLTFALTESVTPEAREVLREQLDYAIQAHEKTSQYMMEKGYYYPSNLEEQLEVDLKASKAAMKLAK